MAAHPLQQKSEEAAAALMRLRGVAVEEKRRVGRMGDACATPRSPAQRRLSGALMNCGDRVAA